MAASTGDGSRQGGLPARRISVSASCVIDADEIEWRFTASGGPGGQHANKASTRVEARFDIAQAASLTESQRGLLMDKLGPVLVVVADDTRSQARNRAIALDRMRQRLAAALVRPRPRRATKPSKGAERRRLEDKKRRGETKRDRNRPVHPDD
jgi:ribosome-associated protein